MVRLEFWDISIIFVFFAITLAIGLGVSKSSGKSSADFFLSGRSMPWWLLGMSMVATTFSTDTPNLVADIVRTNGVSGNWMWWSFLLTGMLTVFIYAQLWRKIGVSTDLEFYALRYGGVAAVFLRGFRALYLGVVFNIVTMAAVTLAAIKIGSVLLGLEPWQTVVYTGTVTVLFSTVGGFKGVVYTDFLLFFVAMAGSIGAAYHIVNLPEIGGLESLLSHSAVKEKLILIPEGTDTRSWITLLVIPLAVQWWSSWYPGAEPGGGGYMAQRMLSAKNGNHAMGATFFFNIMHYAVRPWPWILVALASLVLFPDLGSLQNAFPNVSADKLGHDLAYSAMLTKLPTGLLGLVVASLAAAYISTTSTQLNWGSSYIVHDFYLQRIKPDATERELVWVGRLSTMVLMVFSAFLALVLQNALQLFEALLVFGAGTGLLFILRWFWWRINAWSEISAMVVSGTLSLILALTPVGDQLFGAENGLLPDWSEYPFVVLITTCSWIVVTYATRPEDNKTLYRFHQMANPGGPGWNRIVKRGVGEGVILDTAPRWGVPVGIFAMLVSTIMVYNILFAVGFLIYGEWWSFMGMVLLAITMGTVLLVVWKRNKHILGFGHG